MDRINEYVDKKLSSIFKEHSLRLRSKEECRRIIDERISEIESKKAKIVKKKNKKVE